MSTVVEWYYQNAGTVAISLAVALVTAILLSLKHDSIYPIINAILFVPIALLIARSWATSARHGLKSLHIEPTPASKTIRRLRSSAKIRSHRAAECMAAE